ncbi:DUF418 domain-containing protein [Croceicoccus bisphenolivorans]|uniref:DUF418 domain-containing protein n=1 Tax=Croceicoccus bisphenolivorans TaxID=1783232 RepID=UPI000829CE8B|nr:DUF418 domain-containing protein [Croceicoccus bisphenolivorans]
MTEQLREPQVTASHGRIALLDLARGFAVLGILVINVTTMSGPGLASMTPDWHGHAAPRDWAAFLFAWLFFEGKMRAIFATLFGASLALFLDRGDEHRRTLEQVRRLLWLAVFGYLHFLLFWWGDILFTYAIAGMIALLFKDMAPFRLIGLGIAMFVFVAIGAAAEVWWMLSLSRDVIAGTASPEGVATIQAFEQGLMVKADAKMAEYAMGFGQAITYRITEDPAYPFALASMAVLEALPLMLCGMGLARSGFFAGEWSRRAMWTIALSGAAVGLVWYGAMFAYEASQGFALTPVAWMAYRFGMIGRLAMAGSYLALIVLFGTAILHTDMGRRIASAGRMAFSNYIGMTVLMTFLFHGWGLGLGGREYGHATLMLFVVLGWIVMLGWSAPWLRRFGIGPLELAWRTLSGMGIRRAHPAR